MASNKYPMKRDRDWSSGDESGSPLPNGPSSVPPDVKVKVNKEEPQPGESYIDDNRINYSIGPGDKLRECPYQKSHLILEQRWIRHLCKCRSNYLKECGAKKIPITIGICKWNNAHHIHVRDLGRHQMTCAHRIIKVGDLENDIGYAFNGTGPNPEGNEIGSKTEKVEGQVDDDEETTGDEEEGDEDSSNPRKRAKLRRRDDLDLEENDNKATTDNWNDDHSSGVPSDEPAHNPSKAILRGNIPLIKIPSGLTKRERGTFRVLQIARVKSRRTGSDSHRTTFQD